MAGQSQIVEKLSKASTGVKIAVLLAFMGAFGGLYYYFFYSDMLAEEETLIANRKKLKTREGDLLKRKEQYQELLEQKKSVDAKLKQIATKLPETSELAAFNQHIEAQMSASGVGLVTRNLEKEVPVETYTKVPVLLEVTGTYYELLHFFYLLAETPRVITIENLALRDSKKVTSLMDTRMLLRAKFTASTFRQPDVIKAPTKPGEKPAAPAVAATTSAPGSAPASAPVSDPKSTPANVNPGNK
jgi:Tfp pilus assembly protein PilO